MCLDLVAGLVTKINIDLLQSSTVELEQNVMIDFL